VTAQIKIHIYVGLIPLWYCCMPRIFPINVSPILANHTTKMVAHTRDPTGNKRQPDACISTVDINYYKHATYIGDGVSECLKSGKDVKTACYAWEAGMSNLLVAHEPWEDLHRTPILRPLDHCPLLLHSQNHTTGPPMFRYLRCTGR
jgi:hypothetical protein